MSEESEVAGDRTASRAARTPLHVVSVVLGHACIAITKDIYGHLLEGDRRAATEAISSALLGETVPGGSQGGSQRRRRHRLKIEKQKAPDGVMPVQGPFSCRADEGNRTPDLLFTSRIRPVHSRPPMTEWPGQEPSTGPLGSTVVQAHPEPLLAPALARSALGQGHRWQADPERRAARPEHRKRRGSMTVRFSGPNAQTLY